MVRPEVVRRKLSQLHGYLGELGGNRDVSLDEYLRPGGPRREVERLIQLVVEVAVDINVHVATELEEGPPPDYRSSFHAAARHGLIGMGLAERLAPAAGLRNVLVHEYLDIDLDLVADAVPMALRGYRRYVQQIARYLRDAASS
jgi:uncharacterized protein YutE (UPF0331/DUF86 family)